MVERATGVAVRETIPDSFLKQADQVVNLDLAVEDLQERLRGGEDLRRRQDRLGAGALLQGPEPGPPARAGAARGGREPGARQRRARRRWPTGNGVSSPRSRVMVCLSSSSPRAAALLRKGSRLAGRLQHRLVRRVRRDARARRPQQHRRRGAAAPAGQHRAGAGAGRRGGAAARRRPGARPSWTSPARTAWATSWSGARSQPWWRQPLGRTIPLRLAARGGRLRPAHRVAGGGGAAP